MQTIKHTRILKSSHVSELEKDFEDFCRKHQIAFEKDKFVEHRGSSRFVVVFEPPYLDSTEKQVVEYCKKKNIDMHFQRSADGIHHYEFHELVNPRGNYEPSGIDPASRIIRVRGQLDRNPQPEVEVETELRLVDPPKITLKWWQRIFCAVWPKYSRNLQEKNEEEARAKAMEQAKVNRERKQKEAEVAQKKLLIDWRKMAGLDPVAEDQIQSNVRICAFQE